MNRATRLFLSLAVLILPLSGFAAGPLTVATGRGLGEIGVSLLLAGVAATAFFLIKRFGAL